MNKIVRSSKFQELLQKFNAPSNSAKDEKNEQKKSAVYARKSKNDAPPSVRKSARDIRQPKRYESPIHRQRSRQERPAERKPKENFPPSPKGPSRSKLSRRELHQSSSRAAKTDARNPEEATRSNKSDRAKPSDFPTQPEGSDQSDDDFSDSASAPRSPPRASAFSRVASRPGGQGNLSFLQPQPRDPRLHNSNRINASTRRQPARNDTVSSRRDPHPMYSQPEASTGYPMQPSASMRQPHESRSRESTTRQLLHSRDASMRLNFAGPNTSFSTRLPVVRLTDISRSREFTQRWEDGFLRPSTPPGVLDLKEAEKAKLLDSIRKMIDCQHFTALEVVYTLNSIHDNLVAKMEKFCRRREKTEGFLRNTLTETMQEVSRAGRDRVDAWLDSVGPGCSNASRLACKRLPDQSLLSEPKRHKFDGRYYS